MANENLLNLHDLYVNRVTIPDTNINTNTNTNHLINANLPINSVEIYETTSKNFNKNIEEIFLNKNTFSSSKESSYKQIRDLQLQEVSYFKKLNKEDHIKKMFSTLNYKSKGTTYNDTNSYDEFKQKELIEHNFSNHYKKSSIKTYEEDKIKNKILIRNQIDLFIKKLDKKEKIIEYLKNIYKIDVGEEAIIPNLYYAPESEPLDNMDSSADEYSSFEDKINSLNLPSVNDKNAKLKISKLKKLKDTKYLIYHLDLSNYKDKGITIELLKNLIEGLKILKTVEDINLRKNNLDDSYSELLCDLFSLEGLKRLDLSHNNFNKSSAKKFTNAIKNSSKLEYIDLSYNPFNLDEYSCTSICSAIKSHTNLFHFGMCDSSRDSALKILTYKHDLRSLNLDDSRYKPKAFEFLSRMLMDKKVSLAVLSLKFNHIDFFVASHLEKILKFNKTIVYLNLYSTGLSDLAGEKILCGLEFNKTLVELNLGGNKLSKSSCKELGRVLKVNNIVTIIHIYKNYLITNDDFSMVLEGLVNNQTIVSLGDLIEMKIGVKIRESAESILELNKNYLKAAGEDLSNLDKNAQSKININISRKLNYFKSSVDWEDTEKIKRESLDLENDLVVSNNGNNTKEIFKKYDIGSLKQDNFTFFNY